MTSSPIGQLTDRANIINITNSIDCEVTTDGPHLFLNKCFIRITGLNGAVPIPRGQDQLNNRKFRIIVTAEDKFTLQDPTTFLPIDSTTFPPYIESGSANLVQPTFIFYPSPDQDYPN